MPQVTLPIGTGFAAALSAASTPTALSQTQVDQLSLLLTSPQAADYKDLWLAEVSVELTTTSKPQEAVIASPSGTVTDTTRPRIAWTHVDRIEAAVSNKASSGTTRTLTIGTHSWVVGQSVGVDIGDAQYAPTGPISGVTGTTISYPASGSLSQSTSASGTAWVGDDKAQTSARVMIVSSAVYGAAGFTPAAAWAAGDYLWGDTVTSSTADPTVDLANDSLRAYVQTASTYGGVTVWSPWQSTSWVQSVTPATAPIFGAAYGEPTNRVSITLAGQTNMLTAKQSSLEPGGTAGAWDTAVNCAISVQPTFAASGANSLRLRSSASGTMSVRMVLPVATGVRARVTPSKSYCASAAFRAGASARSCRVDIQWLAADGTTILSTASGTAANDATGSWTTVTASGTAPASAVYARLLLSVLSTGGASEDHYVDTIGLWCGAAPPAWTPGVTPDGMTSTDILTVEAVIERSIDNVTWTPVRTPSDLTAGVVGIVLDPTTQALQLYDYEAPRGGSVYYRAAILVLTNGDGAQASAAGTAEVVTTLDGLAWIKAVENPALNAGFRLLTQDGYQEARDTLAETLRPVGGGAFVIQHPGGGWDRQLRVVTQDVEETAALRALTTRPLRLLVQYADTDEADWGRQTYGALVGDVAAKPIVAPGMWEFTLSLTDIG